MHHFIGIEWNTRKIACREAKINIWPIDIQWDQFLHGKEEEGADFQLFHGTESQLELFLERISGSASFFRQKEEDYLKVQFLY